MFILFLLNILTIFAVIVLFLRQNRFIQVEKDQKAMVTEMEELMSGYIMEMKEENEALVEKLADKNQPPSNQDENKKAPYLKETDDSTKGNHIILRNKIRLICYIQQRIKQSKPIKINLQRSKI